MYHSLLLWFSRELKGCVLSVQFFNKVLYAREGAKGIMDKTFVDFPWQIRLEVDGVDVEVPEVSLCGPIPFFRFNYSENLL